MVVRLIYLLITRNRKWLEAKRNYDVNVSSLEPFVEAIPQVHILLVILMASLGGPGKSSNYNNGVFDPRSGLFLPTFLTSIFSATFGMSKFLKVGPCPIVPRKSYGLVFML